MQIEYTQGGLTRRGGSLTEFAVDELLEVSVVNADASAIGVVPGQAGTVAQYTLTNLGNGVEAFRLTAVPTIAGDDFDVTLDALYLESNATPGLQLGPGGDDVYVAGSNDPLLAADAVQTVYVVADVPAGVAVNDTALLELRAVATTIVSGSGTDDPALPAFPTVGVSYPGLGDPAASGSGNVVAVVGVSYDSAAPLYADRNDYLVGDVGVAISKTAYAVADPSGGSTVVPGSLISYRVSVDVSGGGLANALSVVDPLPNEVRYAANSLSVVGLPAGEDPDDDLVPAGVDNTGINAGQVEVNFGDVAGPVTLTIEYQAVVQ